MSMQRKMEWLMLALTSALLVLLKWLHLGVTNYNIFLWILIGWSLILIVAFRAIGTGKEGKQGGVV